MTNKYLIFDASSGVSGDMAAGALISLCHDHAFLAQAMKPFQQLGYTYRIDTVQKSSEICISTTVCSNGHQESHHHSWSEITDRIQMADVTPAAKALAERIYQRIAKAESAVHGVPISKVHFHEVGSMNAILNVIAFAAAYDHLGVQGAIVPSFYEGTGTVLCSHGEMNVPVPAVRSLLEQTNVPLTIYEEVHGEILTPTGCACLSEVCEGTAIPEGSILQKGYGAGKRETGLSGILAVKLLETG